MKQAPRSGGLPLPQDDEEVILDLEAARTTASVNGTANSGRARKRLESGAGLHGCQRSIHGVRTHPATSDHEYSDEEWAFCQAVVALQNRSGRKFLGHVDYLNVAKGLGYAPVPHGYKIVRDEAADGQPTGSHALPPHLRAVGDVEAA